MKESMKYKLLATVILASGFINNNAEKVNAKFLNKFKAHFQRNRNTNSSVSSSTLSLVSSKQSKLESEVIVNKCVNVSPKTSPKMNPIRREVNNPLKQSVKSDGSFYSAKSTNSDEGAAASNLRRTSSSSSNGSNSDVSLGAYGIDTSSQNDLDKLSITEQSKIYGQRIRNLHKTNSLFGLDLFEFDFNDAGEINPSYWYHQYKLENGETTTVISTKEPILSYKVGSFDTRGQEKDNQKGKYRFVKWFNGKELLEYKKSVEDGSNSD